MEFLAKWHWRLWKTREFPAMGPLLEDLRKEKRSTQQEWTLLQRARLAELLELAGSRVPYYARLFEEHGVKPSSSDPLAELQKLPVLTKEQVRKNREQLINGELDRSKLIPNATGGSTGQPLEFLQTHYYGALSTALDALVRENWGVTPYAKTALVWGADRDLPHWSPGERLYHWRSRQRMLNAFRVSDDDVLRFLAMLRSWRPPYLVGYASALELLAAYAQDHGFTDLRFKAIRSSAETLWPHQRERIEGVFQSPVYNFYGSREVNNLAAECAAYKRMHLISTWRILEVVDGSGNPVPDGAEGHLCVTDLGNFGMPFLRYLNGDMGSLDSGPCPCGHPAPVLKTLLGRSSDVITAADGSFVHGEFFTHLFYGQTAVSKFQVHQRSLHEVDVAVVFAQEPPPEFFDSLSQAIRSRLGANVHVNIRPCKEIPSGPSGKHRFTLSDIAPTILHGRSNL